jgi:hypothetical protein
MMKIFYNFTGIAIFVGLILLITCGPLPTNPADSTSNLTLGIYIKDGIAPIQEQQVPFGIVVNIPKLVTKIEVTFGDNDWDTSFTYSNKSIYPDTISLIGRFLKDGRMKIKATAILVDGLSRNAELITDVIKKPLTIHFESFVAAHSILVNSPDTFNFSAITDPVNGAIVFSASSVPALDTNSIKLITNGSQAIVIIKSKQAGNFKIKINAQSGIARDSAIVELTAYNLPVLKELPNNDTIKTGKPDTLIYIAKSDSTDSLMIRFLNKDKYQGVSTILKSVHDTLMIVYTPIDEGKYTFEIEVAGKAFSDTLYVIKTVKTAGQLVWNQNTFDLNVMEGISIQQPISAFLTDSALSGLIFTSNKGVVNDKIWTWIIPWGSKPTDTAVITASRNQSISEFKIFLHITSNDTTAPQIRRITPSVENYSLSSSQITCKFSVIDKGAGIGRVTFTIGNTILSDTSHVDSTYQCVVKNLIQGEKTTLKIVVSDASMKKNIDSLSINLTYDPKIKDNVPPTIIWKTGSKSGDRLKTPSGKITVTVSDTSGIDTVNCKLNDILLAGTTSSGCDYSQTFTLNKYGKNRLVFYATDSASAHNKDSLVFELNYNTALPIDIVALKPASNATGISILPTFTWTTITDQDADTVYYKVLYSNTDTFTVASAFKTNEVKLTDNISLLSGNELTSNNRYYWQVIAYTKTSPADTSKSVIQSFSTINKSKLVIEPADSTTGIEYINGVLLKWSGATDLYGNTITYKLCYGIQDSTLDTTGIITGNEYMLKNLKGNQTYVWFLLLITNIDTIRFPVEAKTYNHFKTTDHRTIITSFPKLSATINDSVDLTVAATDLDGIAQYNWDLDGNGVTDKITAIGSIRYQTPSTVGKTNVIVTIIDRLGVETKDTAEVTCTNEKPTLKITGPDTVGFGYDIPIKTTIQDDGKITSYEWSITKQGETPDFQPRSKADTIFTAPDSTIDNSLICKLRIKDDDGNIVVDSINVKPYMKWTKVLDSLKMPGFCDDKNAVFFNDSIWYLSGDTITASVNGMHWVASKVPTAIGKKDYTGMIVFKNKLWVIGGNTLDSVSDVWSSTDGRYWICDTIKSAYPPLWNHALAVFNDKLWIVGGERLRVGGVKDNSTILCSSSDGKKWVTVGFPKFGQRNGHDILVYNNKMWLIGGGGSANSIWNSIDGEYWVQVRDGNVSAPPFTYCSAVVYKNKMWIIGGAGTPGAWYSTDGVKWTRACNDRIVPNENVSAVVSPDNKLWIFGGCGAKPGVWYTTDSPY